MEFELLEWQIVLITFIATVITQVARWYREKSGKPLSKIAIQWILFVISFGLGLWWGAVQLPALPGLGGLDPPGIIEAVVGYLLSWLGLFGSLNGIAFVIYNVISKKVFDALPLGGGFPLRI